MMVRLVDAETGESGDGELVDTVTASGPGPVALLKVRQDRGEVAGRPLDRVRCAGRLGLVVRAPLLVARVEPRHRRIVLATRELDAFAEDDEHVACVERVLQRGPYPGRR